MQLHALENHGTPPVQARKSRCVGLQGSSRRHIRIPTLSTPVICKQRDRKLRDRSDSKRCRPLRWQPLRHGPLAASLRDSRRRDVSAVQRYSARTRHEAPHCAMGGRHDDARLLLEVTLGRCVTVDGGCATAYGTQQTRLRPAHSRQQAHVSTWDVGDVRGA